MWKNDEEWVAQVPELIKQAPLWNFKVYRLALLLADLAWFDVEKLLETLQGKGIAWQLVDAAGSVPANIEEGYGRGFGKDYAAFCGSPSARRVKPRAGITGVAMFLPLTYSTIASN
ncbi:MAG: four helix bundle protein [Caldilineaceae bacterium]